MRLDKYLKVSRIIKRRTVANEACDSGRVMLNDKVARASAEVKAGDVIEIAFGTKAVKVKVTDTDFEVFDSMALCEQIVSIDVNVHIERVVASISDTELLDKITECVKIQIGAYEKYN